jgi:hypothetical protein
MEIKIDKYLIASDSRSWTICKQVWVKAKGQRKREWRPFRWYDTLDSTIRNLTELMIREDPLKTDSLSAALDRSEYISNIVARSCAHRPVPGEGEIAVYHDD